MNRFISALMLWTVVMTAAPSGVLARQADGPKPVPPLITSRLVPADSLIYIALDADPGSEQGKRAAELLRAMGAQPLLDQLQAAANAVSGQITTSTGADPLALSPLLEGELSLSIRIDPATLAAVTRDARNLLLTDPAAAAAFLQAQVPKLLDVLLIARPRDPTVTDAMLPTLLTLGAAGGEPQISLRSGATVLTQPGRPGLPGTASTRIGDMLLLAFDAADLEPSIAIAQRGSQALVTQPDFQELRKSAPGPTLLYAYTSGIVAQQLVDATVTGLAGDQAAWLSGLLRWLLAPGGSQVDAIRAIGPGLRWDTLQLRDCPADACPATAPTPLPAAVSASTTLLGLASIAGIPAEFTAALADPFPSLHAQFGDWEVGTPTLFEVGRTPNLRYAAVRAMLPSLDVDRLLFIDLTAISTRLALPNPPVAALAYAHWTTPTVDGTTRILVISTN